MGCCEAVKTYHDDGNGRILVDQLPKNLRRNSQNQLDSSATSGSSRRHSGRAVGVPWRLAGQPCCCIQGRPR